MQHIVKYEQLDGIANTAAVFNRYLAELDTTEKTKQNYTKSLKRWHIYLLQVYQNEPNAELLATRADVIAFKNHLKEDKAPATVNAYLAAVRSFYAYTEAIGIKPNIAAGIKGVKQSKAPAKDVLTKSQGLAMWNIQGESLEELRNHAIIALLLNNGVRTIEITRANIRDLASYNGHIVLYYQGKGHDSKDNFITLEEPTINAINDYLIARGCKDPNAPLFASCGNRNQNGRMSTRSIRRIIKAALNQIGIDSPRVTAHSFRHSFATHAHELGTSLEDIQHSLGHASITMTERYTHVDNKLQARPEKAICNYYGISA